MLAPPPSPPRREGEWSPRYPYGLDVGCLLPLIGIYDSWNALCSLYAEGLLCARNRVLKTSVTSVCSVREKTPQRISSVLSHMEGAFYFSQIYTDEQNTQRPTETLSQPISQNLTANFSSNALWTLYAEGLLWSRNRAQKSSVKSVDSVREKNLRHERKEYLLWEKNLPCDSQKCSFPHREHRRTEDTGFIERGLPSPDPNRSPLRVLLFKPTRHCLVVPSLSQQQVFSVVKNHYISPN